MKLAFLLLGLGLAAAYVLMASNALEFENQTLERTELVERVVSKPTFHADRLSAYAKGLADKVRQAVKP